MSGTRSRIGAVRCRLNPSTGMVKVWIADGLNQDQDSSEDENQGQDNFDNHPPFETIMLYPDTVVEAREEEEQNFVIDEELLQVEGEKIVEDESLWNCSPPDFTNITIDTLDKPHTCELCDRKFPHRRALTSHLHMHKETFSCKFCDKKFGENSSLINHLYTHSEEKPYSCEICGKKYIREVDLLTHIRRHTGERPYSCEICGKNFIRKTNLQLHLRLHSGVKTHSCEFCDKKFTYRRYLVRHLVSHIEK